MEQTIIRHVRQYTSGRMQLHEVDVEGDTIVVRGRCRSYYIKQLALRGILDVMADRGFMNLQHDIEVAEFCALGESQMQALPDSTNELPPPPISRPEITTTVRTPRDGARRFDPASESQIDTVRIMPWECSPAAQQAGLAGYCSS